MAAGTDLDLFFNALGNGRACVCSQQGTEDGNARIQPDPLAAHQFHSNVALTETGPQPAPL
jgi:hypothetical protein